MSTTDTTTAAPLTDANRDRWIKSSPSLTALAARAEAGEGRLYEGLHNKGAFVPTGERLPRFWPTQIAKRWADRVEADAALIAALEVGQGVKVATATHPRHGFNLTAVYRLA